jgi:transcriptional regulator ATRX
MHFFPLTSLNDSHPLPLQSLPPWYSDLVVDECKDQVELSGKLLFLLELLEQTEQMNEKVLVFSQSLLTLDLIELFLSKPECGNWEAGVTYCRLDGSTSTNSRAANMSEFNKSDNDEYVQNVSPP